MSQDAQDIKALISDVGTDVAEIITDLDFVIAKADSLANGMTAAEVAEIKAMLVDLKTKTRATADKVPPQTT